MKQQQKEEAVAGTNHGGGRFFPKVGNEMGGTAGMGVVTGTGPIGFDAKLVQTINLSKLQHLSLRNLGANVIKRTMLNSLLKNFKCLKYLDISNCCTNQLYVVRHLETTMLEPQASQKQPNELIGCLDGLVNLAPTLTHLLVADLNVDDIQANLKFMLKLKALKHLDVSNCREKPPLNRFIFYTCILYFCLLFLSIQ